MYAETFLYIFAYCFQKENFFKKTVLNTKAVLCFPGKEILFLWKDILSTLEDQHCNIHIWMGNYLHWKIRDPESLYAMAVSVF